MFSSILSPLWIIILTYKLILVNKKSYISFYINEKIEETTTPNKAPTNTSKG